MSKPTVSDDRSHLLKKEGAMKIRMVAKQQPNVFEVREADQHRAQQAVVVDGGEPPQSHEAAMKSGLARSGAVHGRCKNGKMTTVLMFDYKMEGQ